MRVLYFTERDSPHDKRFLNALAGTEHQVFVLRQFLCSPDIPIGIKEIGWPWGLPEWSNWRSWQDGKTQFQTILDDVQPDVVHAGPVQGPAFLAALAEFRPLVTMSWGSDLLLHAKRSPWMRLATQYTLDHTDIFLGDCQTVLDEAARYGFSPSNMVRFPWGVDLDHFSPQNAQFAGLEYRKLLNWEDKFIILCNRTWSPVYGVDILAVAFATAVKESGKLRLLLVGDGPQSDVIHQILAPVRAHVHFSDWLMRQALLSIYGAADLYVSPSHCDGTSISLLEAMACGRPVLTSDIPGNKEWVIPGEVGDLFRDGDVNSLKDKLLELAEEPELMHMGKRARRLAEERADWQKNFRKLMGAYQIAYKQRSD
ncbi:MAG: glycosyltransferase family 4 protein [Chloroflexota bacterium]|nr:glycosyltransferase family 4 protein [Chloroflexota bacterium]